MYWQRGERGAALILLIGITATLAILAAMLVMVLGNQQHATAMERSRKTTQQYADGALDTAVTFAKTKTMSQTSGTWLTPTELLQAFTEGFDGGVLPEGMTVEFFVYDNGGSAAGYDANGDHMMWLEVVLTYQGKTSRMRVLIRQLDVSVISALPKAVVYSDTGISLEGSSDVYAVQDDGVTPWPSAPPYATTVMAGGGNYSAAGAKNVTVNGSANLAAPGSSVQSVNFKVNGTVSRSFNDTINGGVGLLSDYFDQAAQADLGDESQAGEAHVVAPTAPAALPAPIPTPSTTLSGTDVTNITNSSTATAYTTYANTSVKTAASTNIIISRATARTLSFKDLYVRGNLSVTGPVTLNVSGYLRVDGTLTLNNTTATAITDTIGGALYVAGTGSSSVANKVTLSAASFYAGGPLTLSNTATTAPQLRASNNLTVTGNSAVTATTSAYAGGALAISGATSPVTDQFGALYVVGALGVSGPVTVNCPTSLYSGGSTTITGPTSGSVTDQFGVVYCADEFNLVNNVQINSGDVVVTGTPADGNDATFGISGATSPMVNNVGRVWVSGIADWSGTSSLRTAVDAATGENLPMWIGILNRSGTFSDVYGPMWAVGNAGTSNVAVRFTGPSSGPASTVMCPLLGTTEKTVTTGEVNFGTFAAPMVYYMMCDNDTLYSNTCDWGSTGTFYGLMVVMEACLRITGGDGVTPAVIGAVFNGTPYKSGTSPSVNDITLTGASTVAYSQAILEAIISTSIKTTTTVTQLVPGSWQQLPVD